MDCMIRPVDFMGEGLKLILFLDISYINMVEKLTLEEKFKNIFLSSVSHNLKTPLNSKIFI